VTDALGKEPTIPTDWDALSPAWMTAALARSFPGAVVGGVEVLLRDDGTNRRGRFSLTYARGAGPATVFLKAPDPAHAEMNARMGGLFNEPSRFRSGVPLAVDHPAVYLSLIDEANLDFLIVMEDIAARGGDPRNSLRPLTVEQAANGVRGLARLHSTYWGDRLKNEDALSWVEPFRAWTGMATGIDIGIKRAGETIPAVVQELSGEQIEGDLWAKYLATVNDVAPTLLHGDPHIGNTCVLPDDDVGFLDWQVLRRGSFSLDLGYFLQGAVTVDDRRASEKQLVDEYHAALELSDAERPSRAETWLRYRASVAHGLTMWLATAASNTWQRPEVSLALAQRYAAAFEDLDTMSAIDELTG
jgi:aminoglycoside phosphotransferase (APT) family kinase protein